MYLTVSKSLIHVRGGPSLLSHFLGSREEVLATLSEMLVADCEFTEKQRREIFEEIKRLHKGHGS
jgi:hypothetical protein